MATAAQIIANQANAKLSTGPVTPEGKARASQNAVTLGLFSASAFIRAGEHEAYATFRSDWIARMVPKGPLEQALVSELIQSAWRLRRCTLVETTTPDTTESADLDRLQASIDRARVAAQRALQRNLNELRRIQTERCLRTAVPYGHQAEAELGAASVKAYEDFSSQIGKKYPLEAIRQSPAAQGAAEFAKQTQSVPAAQPDSAERTQLGRATREPRTEPVLIPRGAPCPCGSGDKYKRCCGKNAPPLLSRAA